MNNEIIFGLTGSGKTGYLIDRIIEFVDNNENYLIVVLENNDEIIHRLPESYNISPNIIFKDTFEEVLLEGINNKLNNKLNKKILFVIDDKLNNYSDMYLSYLINLITYYGNVLVTVRLNRDLKGSNISEIEPVVINNYLNLSNFLNVFLNR